MLKRWLISHAMLLLPRPRLLPLPLPLPQKENEEPMAHSHFKAEGDVEFKAVLFVPGHAPHGGCGGGLGSGRGGPVVEGRGAPTACCSLLLLLAPPPPPPAPPRTRTYSAGMYDNYYGIKPSLKLYVRRVFISDNFEDLLPK